MKGIIPKLLLPLDSRHCQQKPRGRSPYADRRNTAEHSSRERDERSKEREPPSAKRTRYSQLEEEKEDGKCVGYGASDKREERFESKQTVYLNSPVKHKSAEGVKEKDLPAADLRVAPPPQTLPAAPAAVISTLAPTPASLTTHASALTTASEGPRANLAEHSVIDSVRLDLEMEKMYKEFMSQ